MVTEYVAGGELFEELQRRSTFTEQMAANIIVQLLSAIVYCHKRKIVHRDLKLENILIDSIEGDKIAIKIIDFGTAETISSSHKLHSTLGTPY